jgi:hypothetical protein
MFHAPLIVALMSVLCATTFAQEPASRPFEPTPFSGFVLDNETGRPVADVDVEIWPRSRAGAHVRPWSLRARTDAEGLFECRDAPAHAGKRELLIAFRRAGYATLAGDIGGPPSGSSFRISRGGVPARVRVVDAESRPLQGATVTSFTEVRTTDAEGRCVFDPVENGPHPFVADHPRHLRSESVHADGRTPEAETVVVLAAGRSVAGVVVDSSGRPAAGATFHCSPSLGFQSLGARSAVADEQGRFVVEGLPVQRWGRWFAATHGGEAVCGEWSISDFADKTLRTQPVGGGVVELKEPDPSADVRFSFDPSWVLCGTHPLTDEEPVAELRPDGSYMLRFVCGVESDQRLTVSAAIGQRRAKAAAIALRPSEIPPRVVVALPGSSTCVVEAVDERGVPMKGARVALFQTGASAATAADAAGRAQFFDVPLLPHTVTVEADGFGRAIAAVDRAPDPRTPVRLVLRKEIPLEVRVVDDAGRVVVGVSVRAELGSDDARRASEYARMLTARRDATAPGVYRFELLPAGPLKLLVAGDSVEPVEASFDEPPASPHELRLTRRRRFAVTVVDAATSRPVAGARMTQHPFDDASWSPTEETDAAGAATLHAARNTTELRVAADGFASELVSLPDRGGEIVVALRRAGRVRVRFAGRPPESAKDVAVVFAAADGKPLAAVEEKEKEKDGTGPAYVVAEGRGTVFAAESSFDELPPADDFSSTVRAMLPVRLPAVVRTVCDVRAGEVTEVELPKSPRRALVALSVDYPRGSAPGGAAPPSCTFATDDGRPLAIVGYDVEVARVVDRVSFPLGVTVDDGKSAIVRGVRTLAVAPGTYDLTVAFPGCAPQTRRVVLRAGERTSEAFELAAKRK